MNEVICHGIPDSRPLEDGDIVNLDITVYLDGMHGDCSATFLVGDVDAGGTEARRRSRASACERGIAAVRPGRPISDIGKAIESHASRHGYGVVRAYCGHGIGETFHTSLQIPHHYDPAVKRIMEPGMTFTVEPMITEGTWEDLPLGRRLDRGDRGREALRAVRAHARRDRRRRGDPDRRGLAQPPLTPLSPTARMSASAFECATTPGRSR